MNLVSTMRINEDVPIGDLFSNMFESLDIADEVRAHLVQAALSAVFGRSLDKHLTEIRLDKNTLYLTISSSVLRHELFLNRIKIKDRLNEELGQVMISKVMLK